MTEHNAPDISVRPVRMAKSRAEKAKFIEIAPGKHIEASVSMRKLEKRIVRLCAMACTDYGMIEDGDKIAVAMSGGKDSYVLLDALLKLKARAPVHFDIIAVHVNQHIPGSPTHLLEAWLKEKGVTYHIENQDTYSITQKLIPSGKNVCSLCARLRRGILYRVAKELGCTKIALGHQMDDVVSTLLLNMFYGGRINAASVAQRRRLQHRDSPAHLSARVRNESMGRDLRLSALSKGSVRCGRKLKTKRDQSPDDSVGQGVRQPHLQSLHEYHARGRFAVG